MGGNGEDTARQASRIDEYIRDLLLDYDDMEDKFDGGVAHARTYIAMKAQKWLEEVYQPVFTIRESGEAGQYNPDKAAEFFNKTGFILKLKRDNPGLDIVHDFDTDIIRCKYDGETHKVTFEQGISVTAHFRIPNHVAEKLTNSQMSELKDYVIEAYRSKARDMLKSTIR